MTALVDLGAERYVSLTTFRRDGKAVATPVWLAPDGDTLVVTTAATTGKVKRVRHTPEVKLRPCSRSGEVAAGAAEVRARAEVVDDPAEVRRLTRLVQDRYGLTARLYFLTDLPTRRRRVVLRLSAPPAG